MRILGFEHVLLAMPRGAEDRARAFYTGVLGLPEIPKPGAGDRGGVWFRAGPANLHLGSNTDFVPATYTHPALLVDDLSVYSARCIAAGCKVESQTPFAGFIRIHTFDPFGNRIELMQLKEPGADSVELERAK
jgi:catechol 2,3-dioxygenase-like lactoylglutathione lyase family enzyme